MSVQATYVLEVDWNNDGDWSDTGEDITGDVLRVQTRRGRDYASQLTGRAGAGSLVAELDNSAGTYSRFNSSSPIYGNMLPSRAVRLRTTAPTAATLWQGFLVDVQAHSEAGPWNHATLIAAGPFVRFGAGAQNISPAASAGALTSDLITAILDAAAWPAGPRTIAAGNTTTGRWFVDDKPVIDALREIEDTELGYLYESEDGKVVFEDRHYRLLTARCTASQATFSDEVAAARPYSSIVQGDPLRQIFNIVKATVTPYTVAALAVIWTLTGETPTLAPGESRTFLALYPNQGAPAGVYVDAWTTPAVGTDITQSGVTNGDIAVSVAKYATVMFITVTNNHATLGCSLPLVQARGTAVSAGTPTGVSATNAASVTAYGQRTYALPAPWLPDTNTAQQYCDYLASEYASPLALLTIGIEPNRDATMMAEAVSRKISDRVTVKANTKSNLGIDQDFFIEAISHTIDQGKTHMQTTFELSPASGALYWIVGTSILDTNTFFGF